MYVSQKHEIRRFWVRIPGRIMCLVGPTVRRLTTIFCPTQLTFLLHPTKPRVLPTSPRHTTTTIMPRNMPHTRIVFTPTYICTYRHCQYTPKSKTRDTQQKYKQLYDMTIYILISLGLAYFITSIFSI